MSDLAIHRRLAAGEPRTEDLEEIAGWSLARRVAYLGLVKPLAQQHGDPAIRGAALRTLAGARGYEGVRTIVARLDDAEESVRAAALEALRVVARDVPERYVHALFHPRADVRRAALEGELSLSLGKLAIYLRADPECAELAAKLRWPDDALPIALELFDAGHVPASELVEALTRASSAELRELYRRELARGPDVVDAYLERGVIAEPAGRDVLDSVVNAIAEAGSARAIDTFMEAVAPSKPVGNLARRAAVALLGYWARTETPEPGLISACVALEPRVIGFKGFDVRFKPDAVRGLFRWHWPVRVTDNQLGKLMESSIVRGDLALAAAVVGLLPAKRLDTLRAALTQDEIVGRLAASDHGWEEILRLPGEVPALEMGWLALVEKYDYKRYIQLCGRACGVLAHKRLEKFIQQLPRRHRQPAFEAALAVYGGAPPEKLEAICKTITSNIDRTTAVAMIQSIGPSPVLHAFIRAMPARDLFSAADVLNEAIARRIVELVTKDPLPRDQELALFTAFARHKDPAIVKWRDDLSTTPPELPVGPQIAVKRELTAAERERIARCTDRELETALAPARACAVAGLVPALSNRDAVVSVPACVALLGCADPIVDVAKALDKFSEVSSKFDGALDDAACVWRRVPDLPPLAVARLWRWEQQLFAFLDWLHREPSVIAVLARADALPGRLARDTLWRGVSEALMLARYRDVPRFRSHATVELAQFCATRIDRDIGRHAARILVALVESKVVPIEVVRETVLDRVADASLEAREYVGRIVRLLGVAQAPPAPPPPPAVVLDAVKSCGDIQQLAQWCRDPRPQVVQEAALVLVVLGDKGQLKIAELLRDAAAAGEGALPAPVPLLSSILLWDHEPALVLVRELVRTASLPPAWQFYIQLALHSRGEPGALSLALAAVRANPGTWYFRRDDWEALIRVADPVDCSVALADSPHHHAYQRAVHILLALTRPTPDEQAAMVRFLEVSADRPQHLRIAIARHLASFDDMTGLPILIEYIADERAQDAIYTLALVNVPDLPFVARILTDAALVGGHQVCSEKRMWEVVQRLRDKGQLPEAVLAELDLRILEHASTPAARRAAAKFAVADATGDDRVHRVAEVFAWGVRRGVELAGKLFAFHLTDKETDFGHTKLDGSRIFVSALPMLRNETHGRDIVEGLVLHEIGHHIYHATPEALKIWKQAHAEGLGHFLNLIADEHLERNLRAIDEDYGNRMKRLGAYAFQHAPQEIKLAYLLGALRGSAAPALIAANLEVAFDEQSVRMRRGAILGELDRVGHPVARFSRALRMGLGNRMNDPLLGDALKLCGKDLRTLDMAGLYALTKQLANMFGGATRLAQVFGGPEGLAFGERDDDVYGAGIDDEILQREVERILDPRRSKRSPSDKKGGPPRLQLNVSPDNHFDKITKVMRVRGDQEVHRTLAGNVARHAARLRHHLDELGLRWEPQRARIQGRALDRSRLRALVTRNDPRILIARNPIRRTDLFLGVIIDCSGSMQAGNNLDRARRFAILVAEAVARLPGVEARFFGFTDSVIYDAGTATDCNVVALESSGGNNDAAALYHAANVALNSNKRAKVLVMISDGLPTECSVSALKNLVVTLTRRKNIVCAQVAVRRLEEVCFPNYLVLDDSELDIAVAKFGRMIGDLARRSLAS
ncbi:MAG TPA: hypothetical protein VL326_07905 [Kofleriaceae bacterium]|nr:hypothetical protein [Kofleriaceae bacterium]